MYNYYTILKSDLKVLWDFIGAIIILGFANNKLNIIQ